MMRPVRGAAALCLFFELSCHRQDAALAEPVTKPPAVPRGSASAAPSASPAPRAAASGTARAAFAPRRVDFSEPAMGTEIHFVAYTSPELDEPKLRGVMRAAHSEIVRVEALMTSWRDSGDVGRINAAAGAPTTVSDETFAVFQKSRWAGDLSGGVFDVTFHALGDLWKFGDAAEAEPKLPDPKTVAARKKLVDYRKIVLDPKALSVTVPRGMRVDLGGIAKGYAVDRAVKVLRDGGLTSFLAQAGGDLYGAGRKPDGSPWVSGIQDPRGAPGSFFASIQLTDHAFSTAGDYARFFVVNGRRYHHIIDPRTGYPATACRSVTVWAADAFTADAIDDAVFILGPEKGLALVESLPDVGAVIVDAKNQVFVSKRLAGKVHLQHPPTDGI